MPITAPKTHTEPRTALEEIGHQHCQFILFTREDVFNLIDALERAGHYEVDDRDSEREVNFQRWSDTFHQIATQLLHNMDPDARKEIERIWEMRRVGAPFSSNMDIDKL
jgi:hypothetical protein